MSYKRLAAHIDLDAADYNVKNILKRIGGRAKIIGVIKADGYGHGAAEMAQVLVENGIDMFAVATIDEAVSLRNTGIDKDIIILGPTHSSCLFQLLQYNIIQEVSTYKEAEILNECAARAGKTAIVHIKVDTGMGRIGFAANEKSVEEICRINKLSNIKTDGIFTHFSTADERDKTFTNVQKQRFKWIIDALREKGIKLNVIHASNSAGIMDFDDLFFTHVRAGIILYGLYPSDEVIKENLPLKAVMSIKSYISYIKEVESGTPIGYGRTYTANKKRIIATVPAGYADGYSRGLSNKGCILVKGKKAPIVGRVCMDQCMVDITDIDSVEIEDEAVLIGQQLGEEITADMLAEILGTINYEIVCNFTKRVPRVYHRGGKVVEIKEII